MKLYIKSNEDMKVRFEFEFNAEIEFEQDVEISASIRKSGDLHFITVRVIDPNTKKLTRYEQEIDVDFYSFVSSIISTIHSCGFTEIESDKSPYSDSLYFTFCHDSELDKSTVEVLFYLRVSDHDLPVRSKDINKAGARARKLSEDEQDSKHYTWMNDKYASWTYEDSDPTPFTIVDEYVKYEGTRYDNFSEIISMVRNRLERLKRRNKPSV